MVGKNHDAQALTLCLLQAYDPLNRKAVYDSARKSLSDNDSALRQLELCYMLSGELDDDPAKYNNFTDLAKTILARQSPSKKKITKKDVGLTLGVNKSSANNIVDRIHDNARELSPDELLSLCEGFTEESDRFFLGKSDLPFVTVSPDTECIVRIDFRFPIRSVEQHDRRRTENN